MVVVGIVSGCWQMCLKKRLRYFVSEWQRECWSSLGWLSGREMVECVVSLVSSLGWMVESLES
jgi:hypothetical protein